MTREELAAAWLGLTRRYPKARVYVLASGSWAAYTRTGFIRADTPAGLDAELRKLYPSPGEEPE
ncbi:hypothetical protein [uncultured Thermomonospora sp.]|uniref:hypothetical protein n=1 Tax=uncultured Thermomonospora sp. TaxID=671175 RepID=UPI00259B20EE|nr:hypothetical protein [uncultured Thermomonospora sp.]